ncbi:DsbC family protein [Acinetobacter indicus]|uniref:DsbC family protein n=1 Tax=Acinetobacter indicus TaxID=756892 RepID=UPI001443AC18|nr:DsbC family protein [Acinetobacter indicus]
MFKHAFLLAALAMSSTLALANVDTVKANLKQQHPNLDIQNIQATEMRGIYSGSMQGQVVYLNEDAKHILAGSMIRLSDQQNLTKALLVQQNSIDWKKLPLQDALKTVRGTGKRQLAIFSDPNCPYCKQLEVELKKLNDVTIYTFILPLKAQSVRPSQQVYCEANPAQAWEDLIAKGLSPRTSQSCPNPIQRNLKLAQSLGLNGTPAIIFSNGFKVMGAYPAAQIEQIFKEFGL